MVNEIYDIRSRIVERMRRSLETNGADRMDVDEMGMLADMVKDLSAAERYCMEAEYYAAVTDAMGSYGYMPQDMPSGYDAMGYGQQGGHRMAGGRGGYREPRGRYAPMQQQGGRQQGRYGYDMQGLREALDSATPEERESILHDLRGMAGM